MASPEDTPINGDEPLFKAQTAAELLAEVDELTKLGRPEAALRSLRVALELCLRAKLAIDNSFTQNERRKSKGWPDANDILCILYLRRRITEDERDRLTGYFKTLHKAAHGEAIEQRFLPEILAVVNELRASLAA
jgi:hypothetical protein